MPLLPVVAIAVPGGTGQLTLEAYEEDGRMVCGIYQLDGRLDLAPKAWLRTVRSEMEKIEGIAKAAGCTEMRLAGRDWSRVLPDYTPLDGVKNGLRKAL